MLWTKLLSLHKSKLDLSSIQLDGSHTPAKRGGQAVSHQSRKKCKTTNALFLADKKGIPLAISTPIRGNHNDLFELEKHFPKMLDDMHQAQINTNGLFLNADAGFDSKSFRHFYFNNNIFANIDFNKRNSKNTDNQSGIVNLR